MLPKAFRGLRGGMTERSSWKNPRNHPAAPAGRRRRERAGVAKVSSEAHILDYHGLIAYLGVEVEKGSAPGYADVIGAGGKSKDGGRMFGLHLVVNLNGGAGRVGGDAQRARGFAQL